jgi:hypothetical protein
MKIKLTIFLLLSCIQLLAGPQLKPAWVKNFQLKLSSSNFPSIKSDKLGNSYVITEYDTLIFDNQSQKAKNTQTSFSVIKFNPKGKLIWNFNLQDVAKQFNIKKWFLSSDGSIYMQGNFSGSLKIKGKNYDSLGYFYLMRITKNGQFAWLKTGLEFNQIYLYPTKNNGIGYGGTTFSTKNYKSNFGDTLVPNGFYKGICELDSTGIVKKRRLFKITPYSNPEFTVTSNGKGNAYAIVLVKTDTFYAGSKYFINKNGTKSSFYFVSLDKNLNPKWIKSWPHSTNLYQREFSNSDFRVDDNGSLIMATEYNDTITMDGKILLIDSSIINYTTCLSKLDSNGKLQWITQSKSLGGNDRIYPFDLVNGKLYSYFFNSYSLRSTMSMDTFNDRQTPAILTMKSDGKVDEVDTLFQPDQGRLPYSTNGKDWFIAPQLIKDLKIGNQTFQKRKGNYSDFLLIKMDSIGAVGIEQISNPKGVICLIYPNPSKAIFNVKFSNSFTGQIVVINSMGQVIMQKNNLNATSTELNLESQSSGLYHIILTEKLGQTAQYQILKK